MKKEDMYRIAGGAGLVVFLAANIVYTQYLGPRVNGKTVYVAAHDLTKNEVLTPADLVPSLERRDQVIAGAITDPSQINGLMSAVDLPRNAAVSMSMLEKDPLAPTSGTGVYPINSNWIAGLPYSLRRGDRVSVWVLSKANREPVGVVVTPPSQGQSTTQPGNTVTQTQVPSFQRTPALLTNIPVEFVLNESNQEITNGKPDSTQSGPLSQRQSGNSTPSHLELLLTDAQWALLYSHIQSGDQFIFDYQ